MTQFPTDQFDGPAWLEEFEQNAERLQSAQAYDETWNHDNCGVGLVVTMNPEPTRKVVELALTALRSIWHRGAVASDGKSGDGAGIHVQVPQEFFRERVERNGHEPGDNQIGVGMIFLPRTDFEAQERCRTIVESEIINAGFYNFGWRQVPVDLSVIGEKANATRPQIEQILFACDPETDRADLERTLYLVRRRIEKRAEAAGYREFYICSLSPYSLIYKGMFLAEQLDTFFPDLADPRFISKFAIYHQRYSTNTVPTWSLAQPLRTLAHNGEINTIRGNINWMKSHEKLMATKVFKTHPEEIKPLIAPRLSDSAALDAVFEVIIRAGRSAPMAKSVLIPEPFNDPKRPVPEHLQGLYAYTNAIMEPWDGPAAIAATDGRWVLAGLDRNGLRPMRYVRTLTGELIVGSEAGMCVIEEENVEAKGRVGAGEMVAVDMETGKFYGDESLKHKVSEEDDFSDLARNIHSLDASYDGAEPRLFEKDDLLRRQRAAGFTVEDLELIIHPMAETGSEAIGSMGDDTPLAVLSKHYRPLSHFLRQKFAQVTNPPIDPLRERRVMSLRTRFGNLRNVLERDLFRDDVQTLASPILPNGAFERFLKAQPERVVEIDCTFEIGTGKRAGDALREAITRIQIQSAEAVHAGMAQLVLCDRSISKTRCAIPMILATSAVHTYLTANGLRNLTSLNVRSGECQDTHYCAMLISCGATTVNPYLIFDTVADRHARGLFESKPVEDCIKNVCTSLENGILKIMSKLGISVISSYRGGYNFEAIGLSRTLVDHYFPGVTSRISGIGLAGIEKKTVQLHQDAFEATSPMLPIGGLYRYRARGEAHAFQGPLIHALQEAVTDNDETKYKRWSQGLRELPELALRDLMEIRAAETPLDEKAVEGADIIRRRFITPGMSLGALSPEAHGTLNIAMNRIGARSVSGEGGEDPARYKKLPNGDDANSMIKQVASGRFGVTAEYLNQAKELEIKVAQGAKPGEGGQLPGFKVTDLIARFRHSTPGVTLISPPPHHDIYSIEDLAQLIYDLKQINPIAKVCVKLVASSGIGTIAAGVAKAKADVILVSGHTGGTGASPQTSIKHAGIPWEMGLSEVHQVLTLHDLRHQVTLRTDGGIRTGRDVIIAALLGAEEYGIGTASLIALGCIMVRQCHSNTCPVGVCTQDDDLRSRFVGTPEKVVHLMDFIAGEVREYLAKMGVSSLEEIIGRTDLLRQVSRGSSDLDDLDLNPLLVRLEAKQGTPRPRGPKPRNKVEETLDHILLDTVNDALSKGEPIRIDHEVRNTFRAVGTRISSEIVRRHKDKTLEHDQITLALHGSAGQSLGAFAVSGLTLEVFGDANDYVGKGLSGGLIVVRRPKNSRIKGAENAIIGNTVLYGATSGWLFAEGLAGERFAVRNSGATAVIEGCGCNGCEYMTGGQVVVLGEVGANFGAGMTGGMAFVFDEAERFERAVNPDTVHVQRLENPYWEETLRRLIEAHYERTGSAQAGRILGHWDQNREKFWQVCPKEMLDRLGQPLTVNAGEPEVAAE